MDGKLVCEVLQGKERVGIIEALLIFPVAAFHLSVVPRGKGADEFVPDTQSRSGLLKERGTVLPAVGKTVGELKTVVRLDTLHLNSAVGIPLP